MGRRGFFVWFAIAGGVVTLAAAAYACIPTANLSLDPSSVEAGEGSQGLGTGFARGVPVEVRFGSRTGPLLWSGVAGADGRFVAPFESPQIEPGHYVVVAFHPGIEGDPARAVLEIVSRAESEGPGIGAGDQPKSGEPAPGDQRQAQPRSDERPAPVAHVAAVPAQQRQEVRSGAPAARAASQRSTEPQRASVPAEWRAPAVAPAPEDGEMVYPVGSNLPIWIAFAAVGSAALVVLVGGTRLVARQRRAPSARASAPRTRH